MAAGMSVARAIRMPALAADVVAAVAGMRSRSPAVVGETARHLASATSSVGAASGGFGMAQAFAFSDDASRAILFLGSFDDLSRARSSLAAAADATSGAGAEASALGGHLRSLAATVDGAASRLHASAERIRYADWNGLDDPLLGAGRAGVTANSRGFQREFALQAAAARAGVQEMDRAFLRFGGDAAAGRAALQETLRGVANDLRSLQHALRSAPA